VAIACIRKSHPESEKNNLTLLRTLLQIPGYTTGAQSTKWIDHAFTMSTVKLKLGVNSYVHSV